MSLKGVKNDQFTPLGYCWLPSYVFAPLILTFAIEGIIATYKHIDKIMHDEFLLIMHNSGLPRHCHVKDKKVINKAAFQTLEPACVYGRIVHKAGLMYRKINTKTLLPD